jgi:hypothetical protein
VHSLMAADICSTGRGMLGGQIRSPADFEEGDFRKFAPRFSVCVLEQVDSNETAAYQHVDVGGELPQEPKAGR